MGFHNISQTRELYKLYIFVICQPYHQQDRSLDYYSCAKSTEGYGKYGLHSIRGYEVGELLKRYANLIGMEIDTLMYAFTCILMEAETRPTPLTGKLIIGKSSEFIGILTANCCTAILRPFQRCLWS